MTDLWPRLEPLLASAERPARYLNHEFGCVYKPEADFRFCMMYPDTYELGQANQALRILVDNSIKYTPAGGHITLSAALRDGMARLSVQDEGQGIDAESLPHIFDRFFRTDQSRARQTGGTGLGLAIAKWIVDRHGGWFEVRSWPGVGTRMTIVLPVAELDAGGADEDAEQTRPA